MKKILLPLLCLSVSTLFGISFDEVKKELTVCKSLLEENPKNAEAHYRLAQAYYIDQELDEAFKHFLFALDFVEPKEALSLDNSKEAIDFYVSQTGSDPVRAAADLLIRYKEDTSQQTRFILSMAYANLGQYATFFSDFYEGYPHYAESFLAYKTRGILALRLAQHEKELGRLASYREEAFKHLTTALEHYPYDASLYKVLIFLAKDEKNDALIGTYLHKIVDHTVKVARADIYLYVREAVTLDDLDIAQALIDQAKEQYEYSRAISAAEDYLNQHRGRT